MAHHQSTAELIIGFVMLGGLVLVSWLAMDASHKRLDDPTDDRTLYLDELAGKHRLATQGTYRVTIYRQSGNVHAQHIVTGTGDDAVRQALSTFRRASIPAVNVRTNTPERLTFGRMYHDHRGRAEGKKVGRADIELISVQLAPPPPPVTVAVTCGCGERTEMSPESLHLPIICPACSKDNSLTLAQVMQAKQAAAAVAREAQARVDAGERDGVVRVQL